MNAKCAGCGAVCECEWLRVNGEQLAYCAGCAEDALEEVYELEDGSYRWLPER